MSACPEAVVVAVVVAVLVAAAAPVAAEPLTLPDTAASVDLGPRWRPAPAAGVVAGYRTDAGLVLAITRAQVPNPDAWRSTTRDAYVADLERGVARQLAGYRRSVHRVGDAHGVPTLDLEARRQGGATIVLRFLLFRTYALALAIEVPRGGDLGTARATAATFAPSPAR